MHDMYLNLLLPGYMDTFIFSFHTMQSCLCGLAFMYQCVYMVISTTTGVVTVIPDVTHQHDQMI